MRTRQVKIGFDGMNRRPALSRIKRGRRLGKRRRAFDRLEDRCMLAGEQVVDATPLSQNAEPGGAVVFDAIYSTANPPDENLTGLGLRLHFNSSKLTFDQLTNVFQDNLIAQDVQADTSNLDGDAATDMFVNVAWLDFSPTPTWPGTGNTPTRLYTAQFTTAATFVNGTSLLNFTGSPAATRSLSAPSASVTAITPPTADAGGPYTGGVGASIMLDASGSSDANNDIVLYEWDLDNDSQFDDATGVTASFDATQSGTFTVGLRVTDADGRFDTDTAQVNVGNTPPVVSVGSDATRNEGAAFTRAGSFTDPDANTWTATVDYGDGSGVQSLALNPDKSFNLSHVYADDGQFTTTVTVSDDRGGSGSDTLLVTVDNVAPSFGLGAGVTIDEGGTFTRTRSFTDPGADSWTATVDYGDGSGVQQLALNPDQSFNLSHVYANDGLFTVAVTVSDDDGGSDSDTVLVTVNNVAPSVTLGANATIDEASTFTRTRSFTDPGADAWTATVDYGDGSGVQPLALNPDKSFSLSHAYTLLGTFDVTVTVSDGSLSGSDVVAVTVVNVAPTLDPIPNPPSIPEDSGEQTISLAGISAGAGNQNQTLTVTATSSNTQLIPNPVVGYTSPNTTGTLKYTPEADANGSATITVTVRDNGGTVGGGQNTITRTFNVVVGSVNDPPTVVAPPANVVVDEGALSSTVNVAGVFSDVDVATNADVLTLSASNSNSALLTTSLTGGVLTLNYRADAHGAAIVTLRATDAAGLLVETPLNVTVNPVNDAPTLDPIPNPAPVLSGSGPQVIQLTSIGSGSAFESQTLAVTATSSNPAVVGNPAVNYSSPSTTGTLTFTPAASASGTTTITVTVTDNGGTARGGIDRTVRSFVVTVLAPLDFGDAADPTFPTLLARNGARHVIVPGLSLGSTVDAEQDGQPNATATGDGSDEDGIAFGSSFVQGQRATMTATASAAGRLDAWFDFNADGDWSDAGEQVFNGLSLAAGPNALGVDVPASAAVAAVFARFRFSTAGGLAFDGLAADGEAEDYRVNILQAPVTETREHAFVRTLYELLLARTPGETEIQFWLSSLQGGATRDQVVLGFQQSGEYARVLVNSLFRQFLGRSADAGGLNFHASRVAAGESVEAVAASLLASDEYRASHTDNAAFVVGLYRDVLGRFAEPEGVSFWTGRLGEGLSRFDAALQFLRGDEFRLLLIDDPLDRLQNFGGWYQAYLGRNAEAAGRMAWLSRFRAGASWQDVERSILASDEYFNG